METILVIEPNEAVKERIKEALPSTDLVFVSSEKSALAKARQLEPQIILMDTVLPRLNGFEICQRLRGDRDTRDIPVIFMVHNTREIENLGPSVDGFIAVDDIDTLKHRVSAAAREANIRRELRKALAMAVEGIVDGSDDLTEYERHVLNDGGFSNDAEIDFAPIAQRAAQYEDILTSSLTVSQAAEHLGVTNGRIRQRLLSKAGLYGIRQGNQWRLPHFQFSKTGLVPNIERVIANLDRELDPVAVVRWFKRPNLDLEQGDRNLSPLEWLSQGKAWKAVADLATDL
ncbi:MAG: response regulator [Myxococcota bacterium]|nr:response regulator [Myxococcota bacterium]